MAKMRKEEASKHGIEWWYENDGNWMGIKSSTGELFWNGEPVVTKSGITLSTYQAILAGAATLAAVVAAVFPIGVHFGWW